MPITNKQLRATGFASPAQGYEAKTIDMNALIIRNPPATFLMRSVSSDMADYGIFEGTLLVIDRSVKPTNGSLAIIAKDGTFFCRELRQRGRKAVFTNGQTELPASPEIEIFGTVTVAINDYAH
jgi:DNA polymerase V